MSANYFSVSDRLDRLRKGRSETWEEFAENMGVSRAFLSKVRAGVCSLGPKTERRLREMEDEMRSQSTHFGGGLVRESTAIYAPDQTSQMLDQLAAENAATKARLELIEKKLLALINREGTV